MIHGMQLRPAGARHVLAAAGLCLLLAVPADAQGRKSPRQPERPRPEAMERREERRDEVVRFIRETFPEKAAQLERLRERNPAEFQRRRQQLADEVLHLLELRERKPELFRIQVDEMRLRDELGRLAREARRLKAGGRERLEVEKQLREVLSNSFDLRQRIKEAELEDLRARLRELESSLERRSGRRADMVEERLRQLLETGEEDW